MLPECLVTQSWLSGTAHVWQCTHIVPLLQAPRPSSQPRLQAQGWLLQLFSW